MAKKVFEPKIVNPIPDQEFEEYNRWLGKKLEEQASF
jgi:hypothetical protein